MFNPQKLKTQSIIENSEMMADAVACTILQYPECAQKALSILLNRDDLEIIQVHTQHILLNPHGRKVCLDIFAIDSDGNLYDLEIQRDKAGAAVLRAEFNAALILTDTLQPGQNFDEQKEVNVLFICEKVPFKEQSPTYTFKTFIDETGIEWKMKANIRYFDVNQQDETTELGRMMHDFNCCDWKEMYIEEFAYRMKLLKEGDDETMSRFAKLYDENIANEVRIATEKVTKEVTKEVTKAVTKAVTKEVSEKTRQQDILEHTKALMTNIKLTFEQCMSALGIAEAEWPKYRSLL